MYLEIIRCICITFEMESIPIENVFKLVESRGCGNAGIAGTLRQRWKEESKTDNMFSLQNNQNGTSDTSA